MENKKGIWNNKDWILLLKITMILFCLFIIAGFNCEYTIIAKAITDRDLKYHETNFNTTQWFDVLQNVIINTTTNKMHLSGSTSLYEDFTTYIESDTPNRLTQTVTRSTFTVINRVDENVFLYDTKTSELQTFTYYFDIYIDSTTSSTTQSRVNVFIITERLDDYNDARLANYELFGIHLTSNVDNNHFTLHLIEAYNSAVQVNPSLSYNNYLDVKTLYHLKLIKSGTLLTLYVYTDYGHTIEDNDYSGGKSMTLNGDWNLPYLMIPQSMGLSGSLTTTGYVEYVIKDTGMVETQGFAYTKNLLENETDIAFSSLVNATIGSGCYLKVYFSDDNVTWIERLYLTSTGADYTLLENLNYTSLYAKFELNSDGMNNVEILNFFYTNLLTVSSDTGNSNWFMLLFFIGVPSLIILAIIFEKRRN